jgi:hypothetical protein
MLPEDGERWGMWCEGRRFVPRGVVAATAAAAVGAAALACNEFPTTPSYVYEVPPATGDGWSTASVEEVGLSLPALSSLVDDIRDDRYGSVHSVLERSSGRRSGGCLPVAVCCRVALDAVETACGVMSRP